MRCVCISMRRWNRRRNGAGAYFVPSEALSTVAYSVSLWFRTGMTAPQTDSESRASASAMAECQCGGGEARDGAAGGRAGGT